mmetsp:Transcript_8082/g.14371  ORF Transcript_8082/g.14371 Transcript_8082/m.14371 type:complete len:203 (-) Transcript_8082:487-1095(-)
MDFVLWIPSAQVCVSSRDMNRMAMQKTRHENHEPDGHKVRRILVRRGNIQDVVTKPPVIANRFVSQHRIKLRQATRPKNGLGETGGHKYVRVGCAERIARLHDIAILETLQTNVSYGLHRFIPLLMRPYNNILVYQPVVRMLAVESNLCGCVPVSTIRRGHAQRLFDIIAAEGRVRSDNRHIAPRLGMIMYAQMQANHGICG